MYFFLTWWPNFVTSSSVQKRVEFVELIHMWTAFADDRLKGWKIVERMTNTQINKWYSLCKLWMVVPMSFLPALCGQNPIHNLNKRPFSDTTDSKNGREQSQYPIS